MNVLLNNGVIETNDTIQYNANLSIVSHAYVQIEPSKAHK